MAVTHFDGISNYAGHSIEKTLFDCTEYGKNKNKTDNEKFVTTFGCNKDYVDIEMRLTQKQYEQRTGKIVNPIIGIDKKSGLAKEAPILYLIKQSFDIGEGTPEVVHQIGIELIKKFLGEEYQYMVCTHVDKKHLHNHIYFNAVSIDSKHKYNKSKFDFLHIREISDNLCKEYGLSIVVPGQKRREQFYSKCNAFSFRDVLKRDIDLALKQSKSYSEFLKAMSADYQIDTSGKYLKFLNKTNGQQRYFRSYSLGEEYSESALKEHFEKAEPMQKENFQNDKHSGKISLSYKNIIKAKGNRLIEKSNLSHADKLRNIKAMFFTVGVLNENKIEKRGDCQNAILELQNEALQIKKLLGELNKKLLDGKIKNLLDDNKIFEYTAKSDKIMASLLTLETKINSLVLAQNVIGKLRNGDKLLTDYSQTQFIKQQREQRQAKNSKKQAL